MKSNKPNEKNADTIGTETQRETEREGRDREWSVPSADWHK